MPLLEIDGKRIEVRDGLTVLKAAEAAGIHIPHLCYHPAFPPEGSCRMCLVEIEGSPKLELACSTPVRDGLKVRTDTASVREARRSVLEFLLADHPLDCPICDKAGECKLQDYYRDYGLTESRYAEAKERRDKKVRIGEKLILDRERCILCTRCVRFLAEVTKTHELGVVERGARSEISTFPGELVRSVDSGNLVDLCPVGAITSTDFRFKTRPWFLSHADSICPLCARGCNVVIDHHPGTARVPGSARIYRIRPRRNDEVNGHFLCDHGRAGFVADSREGRRERIGWNRGGDMEAAWSWDKALDFLAAKIRAVREAGRTGRIGWILHRGMTNEELGLVRELSAAIGAGSTAFADVPEGRAEGILLRADRNANRAGAAALGFDPGPADPADVVGRSDLLLIFGTNRTIPPYAGAPESFDKVAAKVLFATHETPLAKRVDLVLPVAVTAENGGSFTNADGRVQRFEAAVRAGGDIRPAADILADLARRLTERP